VDVFKLGDQWMPKQINPDILIGLLMASLFWVVVFVWQSSQSSYRASPASEHCEGAKAECAKASVDERLANYTWWLAVLTGALVLTAVVQGYFLLRADRTARIAAESAKQSTDAAVAVESAQLLCFPRSHNYWEAVGQYASSWPNSPGMGRLPNTVEACFVFKNYGKTPAILKEVCAALEYRNEPPELLGGFAPYLDLPVEQVIGHGLLTDEFKVEIPYFFTMAEAIAMSNNDGAIWLRGRVVYDDVFGREGTQWFIYRLNRTGGFARFFERSSHRKV
jgi:hypothetical protein